MKIRFSYIVMFAILVIIACAEPAEEPSENLSQINTHQNIILIILDTLRADHLSCYGYHRYTSPSIDSLAAEGTLWANAQAQAPWTLPAHASIWTGLSVRSHRTIIPQAVYMDSGASVKLMYTLDRALPSLPVLLSEAGFSTFGIANSPYVSSIYGFDVGFDQFSCYLNGQERAGITVDSLIIWLEEHTEERFFCMMHLFDIHDPYNPPIPYNTIFQGDPDVGHFNWEVENNEILNKDEKDIAIDLYDGEICWVDDNLRRLFSWLRVNNLADETLIVIVSDHGEEFLEHNGIGHGETLFQEVLRIPLIMSGPGIERGMIDSTYVGQFDLLPTLLTWAGEDCSSYFDGTDILNGFNQKRVIPSSAVLHSLPRNQTPLDILENYHMASTVFNHSKTIMMSNMENFVSYDLASDPEEQTPLPGDSAGIEDVLFYWATPQLGFPEFAAKDETTIQALRDLGYIND
ncbi:MAG: sulfatase [Candidatus Aegiribacteria sp.]|nr:sulfatase [Candidatus Aegiribacteria sp.]